MEIVKVSSDALDRFIAFVNDYPNDSRGAELVDFLANLDDKGNAKVDY